MFSCQIDPARRRIIVEALLHGPHGFVEAYLLVDTGTPVTVVDGEVIHDLGYTARDGIGRSRLVGPDDDAASQGWVIAIAALEAFGARHEPYQVHVHDMPRDDGIDGLLGMDWLIRHVTMLDGPGGVLAMVR